MKRLQWPAWQKLRELLRETSPSTEEMTFRLKSIERDVILPVKAAFIGILLYYFFSSRWFVNLALPQTVAQLVVERFFVVYLPFTLLGALILIFANHLSMRLVQRAIFIGSMIDAMFV